MPGAHALISGGSSGIGLALARRLAAQGWNLSILARDEAKLAAAHADLEAHKRDANQSVMPLAADVTDAAATGQAVSMAVAALGAPSLLVTSAGIVVPGMFAEMPPEAFRQTMDVNYFGTLHVVRAALPAMRARKGGRIVLISSGAGLIGLYGYTSYAPSKFAVRGLGEALRSELKHDGIAVSVVYPPDTDTPQLHQEAALRPPALAKIAAGSRVLSADEVASSILQGVERSRFSIAPGWEMAALLRLHSLIGPLLNRFSFDPTAARWHGKPPPKP